MYIVSNILYSHVPDFTKYWKVIDKCEKYVAKYGDGGKFIEVDGEKVELKSSDFSGTIDQRE